MLDSSLNVEQRALVNVVWARYDEEGEWPTFATVDRDLDRIGIDAEYVLDRCPPGLVRGCNWVNCSLDRLVELDLRSLLSIPSASGLLADVVHVVQILATVEREFRLQRQGPLQPTITSEELSRSMARESGRPLDASIERRIRRVGPLVQQLQIWSECGTRPGSGWHITLDRGIRKFRGVTSVDELLACTQGLQPSRPGVENAAQEGLSEEDGNPMDAEVSDIDARAVFIVHGRDLEAKGALADFLRAIDLHPIEWEELVARTGTAAPYVGDAVSVAFKLAQAVIVLVTPDDEVRLHPALCGAEEAADEVEYRGQARANVLFEAGMALASHPDRTIIAAAGNTKKWSDIAGRHTVQLTGASATLIALTDRLETAGCPVNRANPDWMDTTRFADLGAHTRRPHDGRTDGDGPSSLPTGTILPQRRPEPREPKLTARLIPNGKNYLLEVANRGGCSLQDVTIDIPDDAHWFARREVLPEYPIATLKPRDHVRLPVFMALQSVPVTDVTLSALPGSGGEYSTKIRVSVYG